MLIIEVIGLTQPRQNMVQKVHGGHRGYFPLKGLKNKKLHLLSKKEVLVEVIILLELQFTLFFPKFQRCHVAYFFRSVEEEKKRSTVLTFAAAGIPCF